MCKMVVPLTISNFKKTLKTIQPLGCLPPIWRLKFRGEQLPRTPKFLTSAVETSSQGDGDEIVVFFWHVFLSKFQSLDMWINATMPLYTHSVSYICIYNTYVYISNN